MNVEVFDESGCPVRGQKGELVCTAPFPSMPVGFWNDPGDRKYRAAYFERFPGVWCHGDYVELTAHDGLRRNLVGVTHTIDERSKPRRGDRDRVADDVGEALAGSESIECRREHGAEKQHEAVWVLVVGTDGMSDDLQRVTADLRHRAAACEGEPIWPLHVEREIRLADVIHVEVLVKEPDKRADRTGRVVVFRLTQQQRAAALEVAQVDVVSECRADDSSRVADGQNNFWFRIVPLRLRVDADIRTGAHCGHRLTFRKNLGVRSDANLQVLGPHALFNQHVLEPARFVRAGTHLLQVRADDRGNRRPQALRLAGVTARLLLDDALEEARYKRDAACLDCLEVTWRQEPGNVALPRVRTGIGQHFNKRPKLRQRPGAADCRDRILQVQQLARGGCDGGQVVNASALDAHERGPLRFRPPDAAHELGSVVIFRETSRGAEPGRHLPARGVLCPFCHLEVSRAFLPAASTLTIASTSKTAPPHVPPLTS